MIMQTNVESAELTKILNESNLELSEADKIKQSYLPYFEQLATIKEEAKKINYQNPSELDEQIARSLRLRTVKVRTGSESVKEERKRIYMLRANVEQQAWNLIKSNCQLDEEIFLQVEKKREIAEKKRKADLKVIREAEINEQGLAEYVPSIINLGELTDDEYIKLHAGAQMQLTAKREAAAKAELERIAKEKLDRLESHRRIALAPYQEFIKDVVDLRNMPDAEYFQLEENLKTAKREQDAVREKQRLENERLKKEAEEKERALAKEREAAEAERKQIQAEADAKLKAANQAKTKAEKKLREKQDAEAKAKRDAELKAAAEEHDRIEAQRKAAAAPDKIKLKALADEITNITLPEMKTDDGKKIINDVTVLITKLVNFINEKSDQL